MIEILVTDQSFTPQTTQQAGALPQLEAFATGEHGARAMTLEGYAGVGKTVLVGELVRRMAGQMRVAVTAPTHKAVSVLRDKVGDVAGVEFLTLHSLLGLKMRKGPNGTMICRPEGVSSFNDFDLVIIDECSMVSRDMFAMIVAPAHDSVRVLFVGDPAQLPPVEDSRINAEPSMVFTRIQHKALLTEVCRQAKEHPAIRISMRIREGIEQNTRIDAATLEAMCENRDSDVLFAHGGNVTAFNWALHDHRAGNDTSILAWRNDTVRRYNRDLHVALYDDSTPFAPGEAMMINEGHAAREDQGSDPMRSRKVHLRNNEQLVVTSIHRGQHPRHDDVSAWRVHAECGDGTAVVFWIADNEDARQARKRSMFSEAARLKRKTQHAPDSTAAIEWRRLNAQAWALTDDFADARHTYAMTIHKSQGSTFDTIIVDLEDLGRNQGTEYNQMLYVAATRPRYHLAFIAR